MGRSSSWCSPPRSESCLRESGWSWRAAPDYHRPELSKVQVTCIAGRLYECSVWLANQERRTHQSINPSKSEALITRARSSADSSTLRGSWRLRLTRACSYHLRVLRHMVTQLTLWRVPLYATKWTTATPFYAASRSIISIVSVHNYLAWVVCSAPCRLRESWNTRTGRCRTGKRRTKFWVWKMKYLLMAD